MLWQGKAQSVMFDWCVIGSELNMPDLQSWFNVLTLKSAQHRINCFRANESKKIRHEEIQGEGFMRNNSSLNDHGV